MKAVFKSLIEMSGKRERCMYCDDSRGTTVEHFWPKSIYKQKCFLWENMFLLCQGCQNHKGNRFDLDANHQPLLINPVEEDPWDFLFFEQDTGLLTARYDAARDVQNPKGAHTTDSTVLPLNIEAVTEGRVRTRNNLRRAIRAFIVSSQNGNPSAEAQRELLEAINDNDDYGLAVWFFLKDGKDDPPFCVLRAEYPETWVLIRNRLNGH